MSARATLSEIHEQNRYNMRYRCPMCARMRQSRQNRQNEPQELTTDTVRTILALKNIVNTTNDLELYLDAIKFLYDIKLKISGYLGIRRNGRRIIGYIDCGKSC